jgi:hypothetical protein
VPLGVVTIGVVAAAVRAIVGVVWPETSGDWDNYQKVALNILWNQCVSLSDPASGACIPHWGGNQLPGFPAFVASVWFFFPARWWTIAVAHSVVFGIASAYLCSALRRWPCTARAAFLAGTIVAISPLTVPWARFTLTETLTLSATIWVLAELVRSLHERRLRVLPLAAASVLAIFFRYDSGLLAIPIAIVGFWIHRPIEAVRRGTIIALLTCLPLLAWSARCYAQGIGFLPPVFFSGLGTPFPHGYFAWGRLWATDQYEAPAWAYAMHTGEYQSIRIPSYAYRSEEERDRVTRLLTQLAAFEGQGFPPDIDHAFAQLADERRQTMSWLDIAVLLTRRAYNFWWNPRNSSGWPVSIGLGVGRPIDNTPMQLVLAYPARAAVKGMTALYRAVLGLGLLVLTLGLAGGSGGTLRALLTAVVGLVVVRTIFLSWGLFLESRYLIPIIPMLETCCVVGGVHMLNNLGRTKT